MLEIPTRQFQIAPGVRKQVPLWWGLYGPSGGGKTFTALRLAKGIQQVQGGPVYGVDTEAGRMLHYADQFDFMHIPFGEPYGSLDYLAVIRAALKHNTTGKRPTVIIDSMSHEHEGPGGMLELHDQTATRMATYDGKFDAKKYERVKMLAWADPKAKRRALINGMLNVEANFILCFRAKESSVPVQKQEEGTNGRTYTKTEVVHQGFVPIGGDDFIYECTAAALLMPGAKGVPTWHSQLVGEARMIKLPEQFKDLPDLGQKPLDESVGRKVGGRRDRRAQRRTAAAAGHDGRRQAGP
jgi:ABC-type dipeptide/oligopeptide/nickel transport system ATPase subunit